MRVKICNNCGKQFIVETGHRDVYLCPECHKKLKLKSVYRERVCQECGEHFMGYPRSMYCPECAKKHKKKNHNYKTIRPLGSIDHCENCGAEYIVKSGLQKYCPECADKIVKQHIREHKLEYYREHKQQIDSNKNDARKKVEHVCVICGKHFRASTTTVTCSPECAKELRRRRQNESMIRKGMRHTPADQKYNSGLPKSGIVGVTYHRATNKWQATYRGKYLGVFKTIDEAKLTIEKYKSENTK